MKILNYTTARKGANEKLAPHTRWTMAGWIDFHRTSLKNHESSGTNTFWRISAQYLQVGLNLCSNSLVLGRFAGIENDEDKLVLAYTHIFQALMGNFTYRIDHTHVCQYPGKVYEKYTLDTYSNEWRLHFDNSLKPTSPSPLIMHPAFVFRFVTCGYRGWTGLIFSNVWSMFDNWFWCALTGTLMVLVCSLKCIQPNASLKEATGGIYRIE